MTSRITQDPGKGELGFPKLMEGRDTKCVYLIYKYGIGTMVFDSKKFPYITEGYGVGFQCQTMQMEELVDFHGTVELRNE